MLRTDRMVGNVVQLTTEEKAVIDLLSLIEKFRIPVRSFKAICKWASKWSTEKADFKVMAKTTRKVFMKKICKRIGYNSLKPVIDIISMPFAGNKYNLPVFSFIAAFTAMITDPRLMKEEFLQFNKAGDIMAPPPLRRRIATDWLGDTNHGEYYRKAYKEVIEHPKEQFLVTLMFFADRTHTDRKGLLTLEPLLFCPCSLFNLKARQLHQFWSLLGYLPYAANYQYGGDAGGKSEDYHYVLARLLYELHTIQHSQKPVVLDIRYTKVNPDGTVEEVVHPAVELIFRALTVNGDSEGQDKQCGKISCKGKNQNSQQCRICNTPWEFDDPNAKDRYIKGSDVAKYVGFANDKTILYDLRNRARGYLSSANYRAVRLGWTDLLFCDNKLGINGAMPPDILHMLRHGLMKYLLASFFGMKRLLAKARSVKNKPTNGTEEEEEEEDDNDDDQADDMSNVSEVIEEDAIDDNDVKAMGDEVLSTYGIFTDKVNQRIDQYAQRLG
jgi:hypothetical protein